MIEKRREICGSIEFEESLAFEPDGEFGEIRITGSIKALSIRVKAGWSIEAGGFILSFNFEIYCTAMISKTLPFWREFWTKMPPLAQYTDTIRNNCWEKIRQDIGADAARICEWEGWHPILRAQLEMFFRLKESVEMARV